MTATSQQESTALAVVQSGGFDLSPRNFEEALRLAKYLADSDDMVPKQYRGNPGKCLIAMQWGMEIGLKPLQALQSIAPINGKPNLYGDAGKALLLANGCIIEEDDIAVVEKNQRARCKITRPGRPPVERTFSIENAKTAGLWGKEGPWRSYPWRQMAWRAFWFSARDAASDLLRGMGGFEEAVDIPEKYMGPADVVTSASPPPPAAPEKKPFPADLFAKELPAWQRARNKGKAPQEILDIIVAHTPEYALSEEQKAVILSLKPQNAATDATPKKDPHATQQVVMDANAVADQIRKAADVDALAIAGDLIRLVPDQAQRDELQRLYDDREQDLR